MARGMDGSKTAWVQIQQLSERSMLSCDKLIQQAADTKVKSKQAAEVAELLCCADAQRAASEHTSCTQSDYQVAFARLAGVDKLTALMQVQLARLLQQLPFLRTASRPAALQENVRQMHALGNLERQEAADLIKPQRGKWCAGHAEPVESAALIVRIAHSES